MGLLRRMLVPLGALGVMAAQASAAPITYDIHVSLTGGPQVITVSGFVTTDGTLGEIVGSNITDWQLTTTNGNGDSTTFGASLANASIISGSQMNATAQGLFGSTVDDFIIPRAFRFNYNLGGPQNTFAEFSISRVALSASMSRSGFMGYTTQAFLATSGTVAFGTVRAEPPPPPSVVPVPLALPLMASALAALGVLGLTRRRVA